MSIFSQFSEGLTPLTSAAGWRAALGLGTTLEVLAAAYPVGSLYFSTNSTNPGTSLGFGTWSAFGAGRVPVGFSSGETEFDTDEETGGEKTHALTAAEVPDNQTALNRAAGAVLGVSLAAHGADGAAHNNLQPYIVVRMWKRTA